MTRRLAATILTLALIAGCDGGDGDDAADRFVGTWQYTSGTTTFSCGGASQTTQETGTVVFSKGVSSDLVFVSEGCTVRLDVNGNTASVQPGQTCSHTEDGINGAATFTAYTFTVNGTIADESGSATLQLSGPGGVVNCTTTTTAKLQKVSN